jgi:arylsulfatase A-like enzyme
MPNRPNIIIFNPDQWRGDVLGHMGNPAAVTPVLDALVAEDAVSFRNAFCQNPVCTPSRCSFMTGWYPHTRGHRTMHYMLRKDEPVLLQTLKGEGYFVWWGGKNDLTPAQYGYDDYCDVKFSPAEADFQRWGFQPNSDLHGWTDWRGEPGSDTYYSFMAGRLETGDNSIYGNGDWAHTFGAIDVIRSAPRQPYCLYLPLQYPHPPYGVEDPWFSAIDRAAIPDQCRPTEDDWAKKPHLLRGLRELQNLRGWSEERWRELRATYYGMCARVDYQLGLLIAALKESGQYDNTAIFIFSDHGDFTGDYGLVEKTQNTFEDCLSRVPFIIKPPKDVPVQPRVSDALVELIDFPATVEAMTGVAPRHSHFGRSLLPVLAGETDDHRDAVFCEGGRLESEEHCSELASDRAMNPAGLYYCRLKMQVDGWPAHGKAAMCRTHEFKYVRRHYELDELYDLTNDPGETRNVIDDLAYATVLAQLKDRMLAWYQETCDVVPWDGDRRW